MQYCSQENEAGNLLYLGEGKRCTAVLRRRKLVLYCFQEKGAVCDRKSGSGQILTGSTGFC